MYRFSESDLRKVSSLERTLKEVDLVPLSVVPIKAGDERVVYRVRTREACYVVSLGPDSGPSFYGSAETDRRARIPGRAPAPARVLDEPAAVVQRHVGCADLDHAAQTDEVSADPAALYREVGRALGETHAIRVCDGAGALVRSPSGPTTPFDDVASLHERVLEELADSAVGEDGVRRRVRAALDRRGFSVPRRCLSHGDVQQWNVRVRTDGTALLVDWSGVHQSGGLVEYLVARSRLCEASPPEDVARQRLREAFDAGYRETAPYDPRDAPRERFSLAYCVTLASWLFRFDDHLRVPPFDDPPRATVTRLLDDPVTPAALL